jgi:glycosyltransferase involved in cell wall biosynthesis
VKVLHVEGGRHLYGGALQVVFLMRGLAPMGVASVLACPEGSAIAGAAAAHARVRELPIGGDADLGLVGRLAALIRRERPDLVHLHSRRGVDVWGALAARRAGVPVVLSRRVDNPEWAPWARWKYRRVDRVVTISEGIRRVLLDEGVPPEQVVCVRSAVDTKAYAPGARLDARERAWFRAEFGFGEGEFALGMAAQFIERKGHRTALEALPAIRRAHPRTRLLLFGQGPLVEPMRRLATERGLDDSVHFAGFRNDLARVLPQLDLLVHPAEMEGLGVALLQAAACGVPIVAGRAGGIPEIVRPGLNGELIEPGDVDGLALAVTQLLGDAGQRARCGAAGRALVEREFSIDAMVRGNLAVYREVLARRGVSVPAP